MVPVTMGAYNTIAGIYVSVFSSPVCSMSFFANTPECVVAYPNLEVVQAAQDSKVINTNSVINVNPEYQNFY